MIDRKEFIDKVIYAAVALAMGHILNVELESHQIEQVITDQI